MCKGNRSRKIDKKTRRSAQGTSACFYFQTHAAAVYRVSPAIHAAEDATVCRSPSIAVNLAAVIKSWPGFCHDCLSRSVVKIA